MRSFDPFGTRGFYKLIGRLPVPVRNVFEWAMWLETADRHVGETQVGPLIVSTVFLGLDHNFSGRGDPLLFETMIRGDRDQIIELAGRKHLVNTWLNYQTRCSTWDQAQTMHEVAITWAREELKKINIAVETAIKLSC